ncbi:hypothetical protein GF376_03135 [Candidatus Peregrinibacteria bacterium]|nr:hypothetical protein [Candidatus Peregrinibacteria bacterium]
MSEENQNKLYQSFFDQTKAINENDEIKKSILNWLESEFIPTAKGIIQTYPPNRIEKGLQELIQQMVIYLDMYKSADYSNAISTEEIEQIQNVCQELFEVQNKTEWQRPGFFENFIQKIKKYLF